MKINLRKIVITFLAFLLSSQVFVFSAIQTTNAQQSSFRGIIIDEFRFDFGVVKPGDVLTRSFTVKHDIQPDANGVDQVANLSLNPVNVKQSEDSGGNFSVVDNTDYAMEADLSSWITFNQDNFVLDELKETFKVTVTINVPLNAQPGGRYGAVLVQSNAGTEAVNELKELGTSGFGLDIGGGPLISLIVDGNITQTLSMEDFYTTDIKGNRMSFFFNPPVNLVVKFRNDGNVHVAPRGRLYIYRGENFVEDPIATFELNANKLLVLPGTSREFTIPWDESFIKTVGVPEKDLGTGKDTIKYNTKYDFDNLSKLRLGNYKAAIQFDYDNLTGDAVAPILGKLTFLIIPLPLILFVLFIIAILVFYLVYKKRMLIISKFKKKEVTV